MNRVLIFYASFGDGHKQASNALAQAFERHGAEVFIVDTFRQTSGLTARFSEQLYEQLTKRCPRLYGASYKWTQRFGPRHWLWRVLALFSRRASSHALRTYQPDAILQLFPDHALACVSPADKVFIGVVLTDFSIHGRWFHPRVNRYYTPHASLSGEISPYLVGQQTLCPSGIPLRPQFLLDVAVPHARPYILLMTGGRGLFAQMNDVIRTLLSAWPQMDVVVLCGRNDRMYKSIQDDFSFVQRVVALGYVDEVAQWLQGAQFAVVKAGGLTIAECLATGCPMVFYRPLQGQEAGNAAYIQAMGAGETCWNLSQLQALHTLWTEATLPYVRQAVLQLQTKDAAEHIVSDVLARIH